MSINKERLGDNYMIQRNNNITESSPHENVGYEPPKSNMSKHFGEMCDAFKECFEIIGSMIPFLKKDDAYELEYDDGSDSMELSSEVVWTWLIYWLFIVYGIIAGFIAQNVTAYLCDKFACWSVGIALQPHDAPVTPVTTLMSILITFCVYLTIVVIMSFLYFILKWIFQNKIYEGVQVCQVGFMFGVIFIIAFTFIGVILPINLFY